HVLTRRRNRAPWSRVPPLDREMNGDVFVVGNDRVNLLGKSFERPVGAFDRQPQVRQSLQHTLWTAIPDKILREVQRDAVHYPVIPDLAIDFETEASIEVRLRVHHPSWQPPASEPQSGLGPTTSHLCRAHIACRSASPIGSRPTCSTISSM